MGKKQPAKPEIQRPPKTIPACDPPHTQGLSDAAVRQRMQAGLSNVQVESPTKSEKQIIRDNCLTYFNLIFIILAACLAVVGAFGDMLFLGIAITNTAIGIFQEIRSKRTIDQLTLMTARKVPTIRNGKREMVESDRLVRDDIVEFGVRRPDLRRCGGTCGAGPGERVPDYRRGGRHCEAHGGCAPVRQLCGVRAL